MGSAIKGLFGGDRKQRVQAAQDRSKQESDRLADQSRILNDRNAELAKEGQAARGGRRGRRLLAYKGQETGLRDKLGA